MEKTRMEKPREYEIPNKLYFRIGEVSDLVGVKPYVLRYWESEFSDIKPSKSKSGQRLYKRRDVEMLLRIKDLLYEERFTINGARKRLRDFMRGEPKDAVAALESAAVVDEVTEEVENGPKQLEVFEVGSSDDEEPDDAAPAVPQKPRRHQGQELASTGAHASASNPGRDVKTLLKIRKDLEELLQALRA